MLEVHKVPKKFEGYDKKVVEASFRRHIKLLGLSHWNLHLKFASVEAQYIMETEVEWPYYKATFRVDLKDLYDSGHLKYLDEYVRHECIHVFVWPLGDFLQKVAPKGGVRKLGVKMEERVVTDFERAPFWDLLKEGG